MNYTDMLQDSVFWKSLYNTLTYAAFSIPFGMAVSLTVAVLLTLPVVCRPLMRTVYFLPSLVPLVATSMIWLWIFNGKFGLLNYGLNIVGLPGPDWLTNENYTKKLF